MILLDYHSLLIALALTNAGIALTFGVSWFISRSDRNLRTWAIGAACLAFSLLVYSDFVIRYSPLTGIAAFIVLEIGLIFFLGAASQFHTGELPLKRMIAVALVASTGTTVPMVLGYDGISYIVFNLAATSILISTAFEYWRSRDESHLLITTLSTLYVIGGLSFALCAVELVRGGNWVMNHAPVKWAEYLNLIFCLLGTTATGALSLGLNQNRLTRHHKRDAETDSLTGLLNRRSFFTRAEALRAPTIAVMVFDIDHFKEVNDIYGHQFGDAALQTFSNILAETVREQDLAARLGGEEFAVIFPDASLATALLIAERVRTKFAAHKFLNKGKSFSCSVSVGISQIGAPVALTDLMVQADAALYVAKRSGRNRVIQFSNREDVRRQKNGEARIMKENAEPSREALYPAVTVTARTQSQRKDRLTRRA